MPMHGGYNVLKASVEYYTPEKYIKPVHMLMGRIDLDPASCEEANQTVRAAAFYTKANNGLQLPWYGRVFLNPPYGTVDGLSEQQRWSSKLIYEYRDGNVEEAVLLCNSGSTNTRWFQALLSFPHCFLHHRIPFNNSKKKQLSMVGSSFFYFGAQLERFIDLFQPFGRVMPPAYPQRIQYPELPFMGITEKE